AFCVSSSSDRSRHLAAFIVARPRWRPALQAPRPRHELGGDSHLVGRGAERLARHVLRHAFHLVEDAARLDARDPLLGGALYRPHPRPRRLLRALLSAATP